MSVPASQLRLSFWKCNYNAIRWIGPHRTTPYFDNDPMRSLGPSLDIPWGIQDGVDEMGLVSRAVPKLLSHPPGNPPFSNFSINAFQDKFRCMLQLHYTIMNDIFLSVVRPQRNNVTSGWAWLTGLHVCMCVTQEWWVNTLYYFVFSCFVLICFVSSLLEIVVCHGFPYCAKRA